MANLTPKWMIYGVTGYTGTLILERAIALGHKPILAGRSEEKVSALAKKHNLDYRVFPCTNADDIVPHLAGVGAVVLAAGPFVHTYRPMVKACLEAHAHYLDITGEISVFEGVWKFHEKAVAANVSLVPGVGFDVVPTDCVSSKLKEALPDATSLEIAFASDGSTISRGTTKTLIEGLRFGNAERVDGKIVTGQSFAAKTAVFKFDDRSRFVMQIPWGDVSSAYRSTLIPNITCYTATSRSSLSYMKVSSFVFSALSSWSPIRRGLQWLVEKTVSGPSEDMRSSGKVHVFGRARNPAGAEASVCLSGPEAYRLTADATVAALERCLSGKAQVGAVTPSMAFGNSFVDSLPGVKCSPVEKTSV